MRLTAQHIISDDFIEMNQNTVQGDSTCTIANGVMTLESNSTSERGWVNFTMNKIHDGAKIEILFEAKVISGEGFCAISLDDVPSISGAIGQRVVINSAEWKPYKIEHIAPIGTYMYPYLAFGISTDKIGKVSFRNIIVNVYDDELIVPEIRMCTLKYDTANGWFIDKGDSRSPALRVTSVTASTFLSVQMQPWLAAGRPLGFCNVEVFEKGVGLMAQTSHGNADGSIRIYLYDIATGTTVNPSTGMGARSGDECYIHLFAVNLR